MPRPSLRDVAAQAGVSVSLVSYALNGNGRVSEETRGRILQVADELGYRGNRHARMLRTGRGVDIGVIIRNLRNPFFLDGLAAMEEQARDEGRAVLVTNSQYDLQEQQDLLAHFAQLGVGGIVIAPIGGAEPLREWMQTHPQIGVVALNLDMGDEESAAPEGLSTINPDHVAVVCEALAHFQERGHRRIDFIAAPAEAAADAVREKVFQQECGRRRLTGRILRSALRPEVVEELVVEELRRRVLDSSHPEHPCYLLNSDHLAVAVYGAAARLGLRVGRDVSVIGHDDLPTSALLAPALTTVAFDRARIGVEALRLLREELVERLVLPVTLRRRDSVADLA
ncbi:LacI family DNA-binding transcriptional regulator [Nesterenkonia lacusekhoensis]|uniref:LacI family transcriptional regulator n=1 Tax=Nesterenkonia lacusekhoensis TaxID=150832 RepID=A0ABS4T2U7_9MICC|nr:LacI family transcriptional regulator [Nesterenkonia lacusekhoensis]